MAARYSTAAVAMGHNALARAIRHAEGRDLVGRDVATLVDTPKRQAGRPSKSLTMDQASALLEAAVDTRVQAYISLCLATGIRTEEARALRWEHVGLGSRTSSRPCRPAPPYGGPCGATGTPRLRSRVGSGSRVQPAGLADRRLDRPAEPVLGRAERGVELIAVGGPEG